MTYFIYFLSAIGALFVLSIVLFLIWFLCLGRYFRPSYWYCLLFHRMDVVNKFDLMPYGIGGTRTWKEYECLVCGKNYGKVCRI